MGVCVCGGVYICICLYVWVCLFERTNTNISLLNAPMKSNTARGQFSCRLLSGYERLLSAKKVTIDNVAFHVPYLACAVDAMHYLAYAIYPGGLNPLSSS